MRRDVVNLQAIASLQLYARDDALQCRVHHRLPLKTKGIPELRQALAGKVREHHRFLLRQLLDEVKFLEGQIERIDKCIDHPNRVALVNEIVEAFGQ